MQWFPRTRATIRRRVWQYNFARQVMSRTDYTFHEAIALAVGTQTGYPDDWQQWNETDAANMRVDMVVPLDRIKRHRG